MCRSGFVQTQVKSLSLKHRKYVVKEWVTIWEVNDRTNLDNEQVRFKTLVMLGEFRPVRRWRLGSLDGGIKGPEPHNDIPISFGGRYGLFRVLTH